MKITFLTPPALDGEKPAERTAGCTRIVYNMPHIYELIVAALLEREGYEVCYKNFVLDEGSKEDCFNFVKSDDSRVYIIWTVNLSIATDTILRAYIEEVRPDAKCVFVGPGATYFIKMFLVGKNAIVARGEPEETVSELVGCIASGKDWSDLKGISYRNAETGEIVNNPSRPLMRNLDELPFPAIHFIEKYNFFNPKLKVSPYISMVSSRNCPFKCIYCVPSSLTFAREIEYKKENPGKKPPIGFRSEQNVIEEIEFIASKGYKAIGFMDDNFIVGKKRLRAIGSALKSHGFVWGCQARADAIDEEVASMLKEFNCKYVDLGVESFDEEILKYIRKDLTAEKIRESILLLQKYDVSVKLNILIGTSPIETEETIRNTYKEVKRLKVDQVMFNIVAPFPGTEFHERAKKSGWIVGGDYVPTDVQRNSILSYPSLSTKQMEKLLFYNNLRFYTAPSFVWRNIRKFSSLGDFFTASKALKIKLFG
ncbi:MAG: radical SAM protein [Bacteroidales bacterium 45-6]|nr:MAG: radical SAM protein [Bacteroidales bacterium 45-6]